MEHRPGTDVISKILLRQSIVMNMIIKAVVGSQAIGKYTCTPGEWLDGGRSDIVFTAKAEDMLPPVLVEVQNAVDMKFVDRITRYCLAIKKEHQLAPIVVAIAIHSTCRELSLDAQPDQDMPFLLRLPCKYWSRSFFLMTAGSISTHVDIKPMEPIVAIAHFLISQKRSLMAFENRDDPTLKALFMLCKEILDEEIKSKENAVDVLLDVVDQVRCQLKKISDSSDADTVAGKRVLEYADDTLLYLNMCRRKYMKRSSSPPSIPYPMDMPNNIQATESEEPFEDHLPESRASTSTSAASSNPDFEFVDAFRHKSGKNMNWQACYRTGRAQGYFAKYKDHTTLKSTYFKQKK